MNSRALQKNVSRDLVKYELPLRWRCWQITACSPTDLFLPRHRRSFKKTDMTCLMPCDKKRNKRWSKQLFLMFSPLPRPLSRWAAWTFRPETDFSWNEREKFVLLSLAFEWKSICYRCREHKSRTHTKANVKANQILIFNGKKTMRRRKEGKQCRWRNEMLSLQRCRLPCSQLQTFTKA